MEPTTSHPGLQATNWEDHASEGPARLEAAWRELGCVLAEIAAQLTEEASEPKESPVGSSDGIVES